MVTSRYFAYETLSSSVSCRKCLVSVGFLRQVTRRICHLEELKFLSHSFSHCSRLNGSFGKIWPSVCEQGVMQGVLSSAKSLTLDLTSSGRPLMYTKKTLTRELSPAGRQ